MTAPASEFAKGTLTAASNAIYSHPVYAVIGLVLFYCIQVRYVTCLRDVRGPFWASLTQFWKLSNALQGRHEVVMMELHRRYGSIVRVGPNEVSIAAPEAVKQIYGAGTKFRKSDWYSIWKMGTDGDKRDLFSDLNPDHHAKAKRMVSNSYSIMVLSELEPLVQSTTDRFLKRFDEFAASKKVMNLSEWLPWFAFDAIGEVTFSKRFGFIDAGRDIDGTLATIEDAMWAGLVLSELPVIHKIMTHRVTRTLFPFVDKFQSKKNYIAKYAAMRIAERQESSLEHRDMLGRFNQIDRDVPGDKFDQRDVLIHSLSNVFAGSDTTSVALRAILYYLTLNPRCYEKAVEELDLATANGALGEKPTYAQVQKLPYLQAVIKEGMRLHPSLCHNHTRVVPPGGAVVAGNYLAAGTIVGINDYVLHRQPSIFGDDAEAYRPERWLEGTKQMEAYYMQFSYGAHVCIGKNIALLEINNLIPQLLRGFRLRLADSRVGWRVVSHTFAVQHDFHVLVEERKAD